MAPIAQDDPSSLLGLSKCLNLDYIKDDIDLTDIEKSYTSQTTDYSNLKRLDYHHEIEKIKSSIGMSNSIELDAMSETIEETEPIDLLNNIDEPNKPSFETTTQSVNFSEPNNFSSYYQQPKKPATYDHSASFVTEEQHSRSRIDDFINEEGFEDLEDNLLEEDEKNLDLEKISMLKEVLEEDDVNLKSVPHIDENTSRERRKQVLRLLELKSDRNRYSCLSQDIVMLLAYTLEDLFDGKKTYLGFKPDYRGYHTVARMKLRRMRYDLSQMTADVVKSAGIGPMGRVALEFGPSLFLYGRRNKKDAEDEPSGDDVNDAISRLEAL